MMQIISDIRDNLLSFARGHVPNSEQIRRIAKVAGVALAVITTIAFAGAATALLAPGVVPAGLAAACAGLAAKVGVSTVAAGVVTDAIGFAFAIGTTAWITANRISSEEKSL